MTTEETLATAYATRRDDPLVMALCAAIEELTETLEANTSTPEKTQ